MLSLFLRPTLHTALLLLALSCATAVADNAALAALSSKDAAIVIIIPFWPAIA